ncbi:subtilisin inhibitor CLSI-II [Cajanus cajan]|uniref:subtilisin inhibitor CLSI-II n=1 Tax=Cajanus cajan TaxID=3821 RepID=UPI00098DC135|nr:subtilisin inhibitor CLSI-II [Cajanus cajan]
MARLTLRKNTFSEQVLDRFGKPVLASRAYYILPALFGPTGGGVSPNITSQNTKCPVTIIQDFSEAEHGKPVKFTMLGKNNGFISADSPLEFAFQAKPGCATSSNWVVVADDFPMKWIGIGTARDHPGKKLINGAFKIHKYNVGYRLVFCPTNASANCSNIGKYKDENRYRLVTNTDFPFPVVFLPFTA